MLSDHKMLTILFTIQTSMFEGLHTIINNIFFPKQIFSDSTGMTLLEDILNKSDLTELSQNVRTIHKFPECLVL